MEQLVVRPLEDNYETITIRTTHLEDYNLCPFKYKFEPPKSDSYKPFVFGKIVHNVCWSYLLTKSSDNDNQDVLESLLWLIAKQYPNWFVTKEATEKSPENVVTVERLRTYVKILLERYKDDNFILAEFPMSLEIHLWKYKLIITWTLDLMTDKYCIVDLKTAAQERKEESIRNKLQKIIYLYCIYKLTSKEDIRFDYAVLRTDLKREQNVKLQTVRTTLDVAAFEYVLWKIAESFVYSYEHNVWPTKQCDNCRFCWLGPRWNKKCPLFDKPQISWTGENT
jgi:hypothetical protein